MFTINADVKMGKSAFNTSYNCRIEDWRINVINKLVNILKLMSIYEVVDLAR